MKTVSNRGLYLSLIAISICLLACSGTQGQNTESAQSKSAMVNEQDIPGQKLYKKNCKLCHGPAGNKMLSGAPDLSKSTLDEEARIAIISKGRGKMAAYGDVLSEEEIKLLAGFVGGLKRN